MLKPVASKLLPLGLVLLVAACATPAQRITTKLVEIGVPQPQARCAGDRLAARLSISQLKRLDEVVGLNRDRVGRMSLNDLARQFNQPDDPAIVIEVVRTALSCAI